MNSSTSFGLTIAYLIPGFLALISLAAYSPPIQTWLAFSGSTAPTVGGFFYATLASLALGVTLSAFRWLVLDPLHRMTGISHPTWDFSKLQQHVDAFLTSVDHHYRYYQFYGNSLVVLVLLTIFPYPISALFPGGHWAHRVLVASLALVFFVASRDTLRKYHDRARAIQEASRIIQELHND